MNNHCVITTINKPTKAVEKLHEQFGSNLIIVGDNKTPKDWEYKDAAYVLDLPNDKMYYEGYAPRNHYARKNLGYMRAIKNKASLIYDTDDDNIPNGNWQVREKDCWANESLGEGWYNVYNLFSHEYIWPRGFSLRHLRKLPDEGTSRMVSSSIHQGMADGEPDVDAIWRLVFERANGFSVAKSVYLNPNTWCPFNSQSTWFFPKAYALMYLPVNASFRMTDIYRSFVAQRCLWALGEGVTFHSPSEVFQDRNEHDLLKDFADEISGYLKNDLIIETLSNLNLKSGEENVCENLITCYQAIVDKNILPEMEMRSVKAWVKDYENITRDLG